MYGEAFCTVSHGASGPQPRAAAFDSALVAFALAISVGNAAGSAADSWVSGSRAGTAQSYLGKGDWAQAVSWANQTPTDLVVAATEPASAPNPFWLQTWDEGELGVYRTLAERLGAGPDGDETTSADNGQFSLAGIPQGRYDLYVEHPSYTGSFTADVVAGQIRLIETTGLGEPLCVAEAPARMAESLTARFST